MYKSNLVAGLMCAWFLISPVHDEIMDTGLPLSQWLNIRSFDTANECEELKTNMINLTKLTLKEFSTNPKFKQNTATIEDAKFIVKAYKESRCVSSDMLLSER